MDKSIYIISTLAENPNYYNDALLLIENEFHYSSPFSFAQDFAPLLSPLNFHNCYIAIEVHSKKLVGHLGVLPRIMTKNDCDISVMMIGAIVTDKAHCGKNIFRTLMNRACSDYKDKVALVFLWSELSNVYEKFSFYRAGGIIETGKNVITSDSIPTGFIKTTFSELSVSDFEQVKTLYTMFNQKYFFTLKRNSHDWAIIQQMSSCDLYIKRNDENKIESYFCYGKGKDLTCIIHELSTTHENYNELINTLAPFKVWLPETEKKFFINKDVLYSCFIKILNKSLLNTFLYQLSSTDLCLLNLENEGEIELSFRGDTYNVEEKDFIEGLFGPGPLDEFIEFGLSPYIAGIDSI